MDQTNNTKAAKGAKSSQDNSAQDRSPQNQPAFEICDFRGDAAQAVDFVNKCWSAQFPEDFSCPQWDRDYFQWQMFADPNNIILGAYQGDELIGFVFGEPIALKWRNRPIRAMFSNALAGDPTRKGMGIAKALATELSARLRQQNLAFVYGFAVPGTGSLGPKFWQGSQGAARSVGIRPWVRPLNSTLLAKASGTASERFTARITKHFNVDPVRPKDHPHVRRYRPSDLDQCLDLIVAAESDADMRYNWTKERLALQLDYQNIPKTLVYDDGEIRGFSNFHQVWFRGRETFSTGMIDHLIAQNKDQKVANALMHASLIHIWDADHALVICPSSACAGLQTLLSHRFLPLPNRYDCMWPFMDADLDPNELKTIKVHLR